MRQKSCLLWAAFLWVILSEAAFARDDQASLACDAAAQQVAQEIDVPLSVLLSISRVETGTEINDVVKPWPWTVNVSGKGYFFETKDQAMEFSNQQIDAGNINFDVGCFQINLRWHSKGFTSLENAFDPLENANYAANFLSSLYQETGSWSQSISAYHSRSPDLAESYLKKVESVWLNLKNSNFSTPEPVQSMKKVRLNLYPLLQSGRGLNGSLMPHGTTNGFKFGLR